MKGKAPRVLPCFALDKVSLSEEARSAAVFRWAAANVGTRNQLGGEPTFLQQCEWPVCRGCNREMTFYAQLDSIGDDISLADAGLLYVFVCFDCFTTQSFIQS